MVLYRSAIAPLALLAVATCCAALSAADTSPPWPQWRGGNQNGVAPGEDYPVQWSESTGILWKTELTGSGGSTPVVAGDRAYLTAGVEGKNTLMAVDLSSGDPLWQVSLGEDRGNKHRKGSGSNPSAVTDGQHVFAYFRSGDLACVDLEGKVQWQVNLQDQFGEDTLWWDLGTSPMLIDDLVVVAVMQSGPSYLVAFDRTSGEQAWKTDRMLNAPEEAAQSYATPLALPDLGAIAVMGADHLTIHSSADGRELGRVGGFNPDAERYFRSIASPVASGDLIVCPYSRGDTVTTCRISDVIAGKGRESVVWFRDDLGSDVPTPAVHDGRLYVISDTKRTKGTITAADLETGKTVWTVELPKSRIGYSSSPLVAGDHLYVTGEDATTYVIGPLSAEQPKLVQSNPVADNEPFTVASLVPIDGTLLLRSRHDLYRIGKK
ncbi:PQQ-binding-like beta-propeller repeat protein [Roseiconus nitratireducens]|uniref:PQQ-binding-like beta-propeller repeat protein n=1 Tax=Roseiconus nitratireducens TaxID=2605748 RepID=A0A5M6DG30_9BACT|nr:PQQ-binding-like beta-propeller repeat protein [Roseiconus nitratireducens]KAA5545260.1 PQQ-binding-like beta-propeller repeat protein [Roseiconus nitratireducens]